MGGGECVDQAGLGLAVGVDALGRGPEEQCRTWVGVPRRPRQPIRLQQIERHDVNAYRQIVGGDLEVVALDRPPAAMYLNEEGKLNLMRV